MDTAVVIPYYNKPGRPSTLDVSFANLIKQDLDAIYIVVELLFDDAEPSSIDVPAGKHIKIKGEDKHKDIFQKECLLNIGFRYLESHFHSVKYVIFLDGDVYCEDRNWFKSIREKLVSEPNKVVQVYSSFEDTGHPGMITYSDAFLLRHCISVEKTNKLIKEYGFVGNPGIGYGIGFDNLKSFGLLNTSNVLGGGDYFFIREMCFNGFHKSLKTNRSRFLDKHTDPEWRHGIGSGLLDYVDYHIKHIFHGEFNHRCYLGRRYAMGFWNRPRDEITPVGEDGLRFWKDPKCDERLVTRDFLLGRVHNETAYNSYRLLEESGYSFDRSMSMKIGMCILDDENRVIDIKEMFDIPDLSHHDPNEQPLADSYSNMNLRIDLDGSQDKIICKQLDSTGQCQIGVANWLEDQSLNQYYRYVMIASDMTLMTNRVSFIPNQDGLIKLILRSDYKVNYDCYVEKISAKGCEIINEDFEEVEEGCPVGWALINKDSLITNFSRHGKICLKVNHDDYAVQSIFVTKDQPVELVFYHRCLL